MKTPLSDELRRELIEACKQSGVSPVHANKSFDILEKFRLLEVDHTKAVKKMGEALSFAKTQTGHRMMAVANPFRQLVNILK